MFSSKLMIIIVLVAIVSGCSFHRPKVSEIMLRNEHLMIINEALEKEVERLSLENEKLLLTCQDLKLKFEAAWAQRSRIGGSRKGPKTIMWCDPDGEVTIADNEKRTCQVNIGRENGVKAGSIFEVFRYVKGGTRKVKGRIEIGEVEGKVSQAAIIELNNPKDDLIVKGDHIISPLFDKERIQEFVFAGELVNTKYTGEEVTRLVEKMGAKVAPEVTVETDFLVAGRDSEKDEDYQRAIDLGVTILSEKQLLNYITK